MSEITQPAPIGMTAQAASARTVATSGSSNPVLMVASCREPLVAVIDAAGPEVFDRLKLAVAVVPEEGDPGRIGGGIDVVGARAPGDREIRVAVAEEVPGCDGPDETEPGGHRESTERKHASVRARRTPFSRRSRICETRATSLNASPSSGSFREALMTQDVKTSG